MPFMVGSLRKKRFSFIGVANQLDIWCICIYQHHCLKVYIISLFSLISHNLWPNFFVALKPIIVMNTFKLSRNSKWRCRHWRKNREIYIYVYINGIDMWIVCTWYLPLTSYIQPAVPKGPPNKGTTTPLHHPNPTWTERLERFCGFD